MPKKIAVLISKSFEDTEYSETIEALRAARHAITNIEKYEGQIFHGRKCRSSLTIDKSINGSSALDFDALLILGDFSSDPPDANSHYINFVKQFARLNKPILCSCHGHRLLIDASLVQGKQLTTHNCLSRELINAGAVFLDQPVVNDNNQYISARSYDDLPAFISESLNVLRL
jgi:protease I